MKARPEATSAGIDGARPTETLASVEEASRHPWDHVPRSALAPVDALIALTAFNANQAVTAQIDFAHSFARALQDHAELTEAGARAFAPGAMRNVVAGAARLESRYARQVAQAAQAMGRRFGHLAFAFPAATPFR